MTEKYIVGMEVSKKQAYIFNSDKLKEIIGASRIIRLITEYLPKKYLNNGKVIYSGGGNSFFYFDDIKEAEEFISYMSFDIIKHFPEIEVFFITEINNEDEIIDIKKVRKSLEKKKLERRNYFRKVSFGLEEICDNSKYPACKMYNERAVSQDTYLKSIFSDDEKINIEAKKILGDRINKEFYINEIDSEKDEIKNFDEFKDKIAVVSLDGNKMAEMVNLAGHKVKELSDIINTAYKNAFIKVENLVRNSQIYIKEYDKETVPLRKLILAGDDVCYIIDSRLALKSVDIFLKILAKEAFSGINNLNGKTLTACAGVVVANKKYPFNVVYDMAEELNKKAKAKIRENEFKNSEMSIFSYELVKGEVTGREYRKNKLKDFYILSYDKEKRYELENSDKYGIMNFEIFDDILKKLKENSENEKNRIGKIREILSEEFDENYFRININKYVLEKAFKESFKITKKFEDLNSYDYTKAVKITDMIKHYEF